MNTTNLIAIYGAVLSTVVAGWNIYKQVTRGPKLVGSVTPNMNEFDATLLGVNSCVDLILSNRGNAETTITNVVVLCYKNRLDRWGRKYSKRATITRSPPRYKLPYKLGTGHEFRCLLLQDAELEEWSRKYLSYLCVCHSMSNRPVHFRLMPIKTKHQQAGT